MNINSTDEIIDSMDINNLKTMLKAKCEEVKVLDKKNKDFNEILEKETNKINELQAIIRIQKKEIRRNNKLTIQLKKEINSLKSTKSNPQNYFIGKKKRDYENQNIDSKDDKTMKLQLFSGDSDSIISKIEPSNLVKKWFADEEKLSFNFCDLEINLKKLVKPDNNSNFYQSEMRNEFKFIEAEIRNLSSSSVSIKNLEIHSSESK